MHVIGSNILYFDELESTNSYGLNLLKEQKVLEGTVILAGKQTQGRGQRGNAWVSSSENLTFSIVLLPKFLTAQEQFLLNKAVALAIRGALEKILVRKVYVKWPNDIYVADKKIAGILIENSIRAKNIESSVIGIGLNVNKTDFPESIKQATSMKLETGKDYNLAEVLKTVCDFINARYIKFFNNIDHQLDHEYLEQLYRYDDYCDYRYKNSIMKAKIVSVSIEGNLILKDIEGATFSCGIKEVVFL